MATIYKKIGERIRKIRKQKGLSQEELAEKAKLDLTSISEIEGGLRNPSIRTVHRITSALKINIKELFPK